MRLITIASLGASAVLGLGAIFVAKTAMPTAKATASAAGLPMAGAVPFVVASRPIRFGEKLNASHLAIARAPREAVPEGAFATIDAVLKQDAGGAPVTLTTIAAREPLLPAKLSGPGARASVAAEIKPGFRAYTIKVTDVSGVGGHALPGDRVDVVLSCELKGKDDDSRAVVSEVVLQNVRVLGVDLNLDQTANKPATPNTVTLEVAVIDAQKLAVAADLGTLSLALRPSGAAEVESVKPIQTRDVSLIAPRVLTPQAVAKAMRGPAGPRPAALPQRRTIIIVEGDGAPSKAAPPPAQPAPAAGV